MGMVLGLSCAFVAVLMVPGIRQSLSLKGARGKVASLALLEEKSLYLKTILETVAPFGVSNLVSIVWRSFDCFWSTGGSWSSGARALGGEVLLSAQTLLTK